MRRQHHQPTPPSPSWISIRNNRSASLPRIRLARRESHTSTLEDGGPSTDTVGITDTVGSGVRSWAKQILAGVSGTPSPMNAPVQFHPTSETPFLKPPLRRTPVLTLALLKLEEQLSTYCRYLAEPSLEHVAAACDLLSRTIATASPVTSSERGSPAFLGSPQNSSPRAILSPPTRSPLRSFFGSSSSQVQSLTSSGSALALEGEWERFAMPLFLLAGAEALYASLGHAQDPFVAAQLRGLYHRIINDVNLVRETLCDPFLIDQHPEQKFAPTLAMYYERASTVSATLNAIVSMAQIRCRLIQFQSTLWESKKPNFGEFMSLMDTILLTVPSEEDSSFAQPIVKTLRKEVEAWKYLMETAHSLERCRFSEAILSSQKTKLRLNLTSTTHMQQWLLQTLQRLIALFQVYFDRVHTFAKPLYGFQNVALVDTDDSKKTLIGGAHDSLVDVQVLDFLHRQQKSGSSALAVTVVLDAVRTSNLDMERGFTVVDSSVEDSKLSDLETTRLQWPAVYMRSTKYRGESQAGGGLLGGKRRTTNRTQDEELPKNSSFADHYIRWSTDASSPTRSNEKTYEKDMQLNFQEYAPGEGGTSWPHSEWNNLVRLMNEKGDMPLTSNPMSASEASPEISDDGFFHWLGNSGLSNFLENEPSPAQTRTRLKRTSGGTAFYISALSDFAWLIVMTKAEEESRWHRRRGSKIEDEVEEFLEHLSSLLRIADLFNSSHDQKMRRNSAAQQHGIDLVQEIRNGGNWNDENVQDLVQSLKVAFGLKSNNNSFAAEPLKASYNMGFRSRKSPKVRPLTRASAKLDVSAMAFFLGADLMHAVSSSE